MWGKWRSLEAGLGPLDDQFYVSIGSYVNMVLASRMRPYRILGVANRVLELPTFIDDVVRGQPPLLKVKLRQRSIHFVGGVSTDYGKYVSLQLQYMRTSLRP